MFIYNCPNLLNSTTPTTVLCGPAAAAFALPGGQRTDPDGHRPAQPQLPAAPQHQQQQWQLHTKYTATGLWSVRQVACEPVRQVNYANVFMKVLVE